MDVRELYGASELQRENPLAEEVARLSHAALMAGVTFAMPVQVTESSPDGHNSTVMPAVMRAILDPVTGQRSFENYPVAPDTPIHYPGGGGTTLTHPVSAQDEGVALYLSRNIDGWRSQGGTAQPIDNTVNDHGDAVLIPGIRSDPRKLAQVSTAAMHLRSDDKRVVHETHPTEGIQAFHADPSTPPASASFDPLVGATTFYRHLVQAAAGILGQAVSPAGTHEHGVAHDVGAFMRALGGLHTIMASPTLGALLSAANGAHTVTASPSGVNIQSATAVGISAPPGMLSLAGLAGGSIGGAALASGAASSNVGQLGGDLAGDLPDPQVVSIANLVGMDKLPRAASDAAAAALTPQVPVGSPYLNTAVSPGVALLAIRIA